MILEKKLNTKRSSLRVCGIREDRKAAQFRLRAPRGTAFFAAPCWRTERAQSMPRCSLPVTVNRETSPDWTPPTTPATAHFCILEVTVPRTFTPLHERYVPPLVACHLRHEQARDLAISLNADVLRRGAGGPWHVLVVTGRANSYGVARVHAEDLPAEPDRLPESVQSMTACPTSWKRDALASCDATNRAVLRACGVPGVWNITIRAMTDPTTAELPPEALKPSTPGKANPQGPTRELCQDIDDWDQPADWQTTGHLLQTGGAN